MKKHVLDRYATTKEFNGKSKGFYDGLSQITYMDKGFKKKMLYKMESTLITETVENSDPDEFSCNVSTKQTYTIENSDTDEFNCKESTIETAEIETSDPDELNLLGNSIETRMIETSDADEFIC